MGDWFSTFLHAVQDDPQDEIARLHAELIESHRAEIEHEATLARIRFLIERIKGERTGVEQQIMDMVEHELDGAEE